MSLNVDSICPITPELEAVARSRCHEIIKEWARQLSIWGTTELSGGPQGPRRQTFTIEDLALACYIQGTRDAVAVAVTSKVGS